MSRNIGILNYKGGTGKTTTAINLAAGLARRGNRVFCIDLDPQGSLASQLGINSTKTLAELFVNEAAVQECIYPARDNLDVLPGSRKLLSVDGILWKMESASKARRILAETKAFPPRNATACLSVCWHRAAPVPPRLPAASACRQRPGARGGAAGANPGARGGAPRRARPRRRRSAGLS